MTIYSVIVCIGAIFAITGIVLFIKGIGKGEKNKLKFLGGIELEASSSALVVFVVGTALIALTVNKLENHDYQFRRNYPSINSQMDSIGTTGWIFLGYYDASIPNYSDGPFFTPYKSSYTSNSSFFDSIKVHKGDIIQTTKDRRVIILNYKEKKDANVLKPPLQDIDYKSNFTGVILPNGTRLKVEDISIASYPPNPYAIWARIRLE